MKDNVVQVNLCLTIGEMWSQSSILRKNKKEYEKIIRNRSIGSYLFRIFLQ